MVDNLIRLYNYDETSFTTNGLGTLADATECKVTEELNGSFELAMKYPIDGARYSDIDLGMLIYARPNQYSDFEPFRIYSISRPLNGIVTINAQHISYDLSGYIMPRWDNSTVPFATGPRSAFTRIDTEIKKVYPDFPFTFYTDSDEDHPAPDSDMYYELTCNVPKSVRALLGDGDGNMLSIYTGDYLFEKFNVSFLTERGEDKGVTIKYGKNMTELTVNEDNSTLYSAVYPYWTDQERYVELPEKVIRVRDDIPDNTLLLDLSSDFAKCPADEDIREFVERYINDNNLGLPFSSIDVSFEQLSRSSEYSQYAMLEQVELGDYITVEYDLLLNGPQKVRCTKVVYDVLLDKAETIELGTSRTLVSSLAKQQSTLSNSTQYTDQYVQEAVKNITYDSALSTTSENAVQNKVVTKAINDTNGRVKSLEDCCKNVKGEINTIIETIEGLTPGTGSVTYGYSLPTGGNDGDVYLQIVDGSGDVPPSDMTGATWVGYTDNTCEYDPDTQRFEIASTGHWRYYNYSFGMVELDFDKIDTIYIKGTCVAESLSGNEGSWALVVGVGDKTPTQVAESDPTAIEGFGITALFDSYIMSWDDPDLQPGEYYLKTGEDFIFQFDVSAITGAHYLSIVTSRSTQVDISSIQFTADTPAQIVDIWLNNEGTWIKEEETSGIPAGGTTGQVLGKLSDTDYDLGWINQSGGGRSGATQELLYSGNSLSQSIQLSKSWTDFDALYILGEDDTSGSTFVFASTLFKDDLTTDYRIGISTDIGYIWYSITNNTMLSLIGAYTGYYIKSIRGIKFSGGGGGGGGSYTETVLYNAWNTFAAGDTITLSDDFDKYDELVIYTKYHETSQGDFYMHFGSASLRKETLQKSYEDTPLPQEFQGIFDFMSSPASVPSYQMSWMAKMTAKNQIYCYGKSTGNWNANLCGIYKVVGIKY